MLSVRPTVPNLTRVIVRISVIWFLVALSGCRVSLCGVMRCGWLGCLGMGIVVGDRVILF